jgi:NAD(P)-dependent dehydrogenase (short-subunit alcohol dehydrogenase family)
MSLKDQRIVVIGGTSGIGLTVAQRALAEGASVVVGSSSATKVEAAKARLPEAQALVVDVKDEASVAAFFEQIGALDHLVFTAGDWGASFGGGAIESVNVATAASLFAVRFWGAVTAVKHAAKRMRAGGSITLTDGMIAHRSRKGAAISGAMAGARWLSRSARSARNCHRSRYRRTNPRLYLLCSGPEPCVGCNARARPVKALRRLGRRP